ncbi:phosphatidate cytidylyltransferase [candidate division NPL-UPA2 bacterium]|nr:phosphatidate cytidylyltransferase [candidate division NPL-UPA2 bacterium]
MRNRLLMTVLFVPLFILFIVWGGRPFFFLILAISLIGLFEFYQIMETRQIKPLTFPGLLMAVGLLVAISAPLTLSLVIAVSVMVILLGQMKRNDLPGAVTNCAVTVFGLLYVVGLLGHLIVLRNLEGGLSLVLTVWFITWLGDSGAFAIGKSRGKRKLFPRVSPHKTVEGALGGVGAAILASFVAYFALRAIFGNAPFPISHAFFLGLTLGIVGILGDLSESLLKRDAQVKDSGGRVPGHGGILDTFDSLLFTAPVMYYYAMFILPG